VSKRVDFEYRDLVRVKETGRRAFTGRVYSQYRMRGPRSERIICVYTPSGAGVGYRVRYVTLIRKGGGT
jgi:hypothetical protein